MPLLALFSSTSINLQTTEQAFGVESADKFRVTSSFTISANTKAYAMFKGTLLLQQQNDNLDKVNLILRPNDQKEFKLPIKYLIYRGLHITDFIDNNNLNDPNNTVNTSGSELLAAMKLIQQNRAPDNDIPLEALFGNNLNPANDKNIDEFFFNNVAPSSQLFTIECGIELGNFATGEIGVEIILQNPEFFVDVNLAKKAVFEIQIDSNMSSAEVNWQKDLIRHFVDPAAYYGLHYDIEEGIEYRDSSENKQQADTLSLVYNQILKPFENTTRNIVYLDIRNENGYSYNYYGNYVGTEGSNIDKELKIGPTSMGINPKEYYTNGWPIHKVDIITPSTSANYNNFFIALRINDNEKPLLAGFKNILSNAVSPDENQLIKFIDESSLLPSPVPNPLPEFTEPVEILVPNYLSESTGAQVATIVKLDYIKQIRLRDENDVFPQENPSDHLFGPINTQIPWNSSDKTQWITSHHFKYFDSLNNGFAYGVMEELITAINPSLKTIKIGVDVANQITNKLEIINASNSDNVGEYNVINVENTGANETTITVRETLNTLQTGDKLKFKIEVAVSINYIEKKMIAEDIDLSGISAFDTGKKVWLYTKKGDLPKRYSISSRTFGSGDTTITVSETIDKEGFGAIVQTGIVRESNATNGDRVLLYTAPRYYFKKTGIKDTSFFNYQGATHNEDSFLETLQERIPDFKIEKYSLQPQAGQFVATLAYPEDTVAKENLLFLGLSHTELNSLKTAANNQLSLYHIQMLKLVPQGNRLRDEDYESYYEFNVVVTGLDSNGNYLEAYPTSAIKVFSKDQLIFNSDSYAKQDLVSEQVANDALDLFLNNNDFSGLTKYSNEEIKELSKDLSNWNQGVNNKALLDLDPILKNLIFELRNELNITNNNSDIELLLQQKGAELITLARQRIREDGAVYKNKDGILYVTRLMMQVLLKNHPKIINQTSLIQTFSDIFEKNSRGLEGSAKADFFSYPTNYKKILISGYDPFSLGKDWQGHISNPSGNIALALDGVVWSNAGNTVVLRAPIIPVRYREFNEGWIEKYFTPFVKDEDVDMIITFSYGLGEKRGQGYFNLDRISSRKRNSGHRDNDEKFGGANLYLIQEDKNPYEFIENTLGTGSNFNDYSDWTSETNNFRLSQYYIGTLKGNDAQNNPLPIIEINSTRVDYNSSILVEFPEEGNLNFHPEYASNRKITAAVGSGGDYLSNEIFYRVAFLRKTLKPNKRTGHIHVGFLEKDLNGKENNIRDIMLNTLELIIKDKILPTL